MRSKTGSLFRGFMRIPVRAALAVGIFCVAAQAVQVRYSFQNVTFAGGGTASGSFVFDADAGTPCATTNTPCGQYSQVNITTTTGGGVPGATYTFVCGGPGGVATCTGASPDSTEVLFLTSNAANQMGLPGLAVFFTGIGVFPPAGLSDTGGTFDISNASLAVGAVQEAPCADAACSTPGAPSRASATGTVFGPSLPPGSIPTLSEWGMILFAVLLVGYAALRMRTFTVTAALVLLTIASVSNLRAADQPESKPKPVATERAKPADPKANSQDGNAQANQQADEKDKPHTSQGGTTWRPKH